MPGTYKKRQPAIPENGPMNTVKTRRPSIHPTNFFSVYRKPYVRARGTPRKPKANHTGKLGNKGTRRA